MTDPTPYVHLAMAILSQAASDAHATATNSPCSVIPTAADVADAHAFLAHPVAEDLAELLALSRDIPRRHLLQQADNTTGDDWLTVAEAAHRFGYHPESLRNLIRQQAIHAKRTPGGGKGSRAPWLINAAALAAYAQRSAEPVQVTYAHKLAPVRPQLTRKGDSHGHHHP